MELFIKFLMVADVLVAVILCILIFLQRSKSGGGLGGLVGGGATEEVFGAGGTSFVVKATIAFTTVFLVNSLLITSLQARVRAGQNLSVVEQAGMDDVRPVAPAPTTLPVAAPTTATPTITTSTPTSATAPVDDAAPAAIPTPAPAPTTDGN